MYTIFTCATIYSTQSSTNVHDLYTCNDLQYTKQYKCTRSLHSLQYTIFTQSTVHNTNVHDLYTCNDLQYTKQYKCTRSLHVQRSTVHKVVQMYTIFTRATIYSTQSSTNVHDLYTCNDLQYTKQYKCTRSLHRQRSTVHKVVQMYTIFTRATIYSTQSSTNVHDLYTCNDLQYTMQYKCTRSLHRQRSTVHKVVQMYTIFTQATIYSTQSSTNVHDLYTCNDLQYTKQYKCTRSLHVQRSTVHKVVQMYTIFTQATIYSTQSSTNVHDLYTCNDLQYTKQYKCTRSLHVQRSTVHKVVQMYTIFTRATIYSTQSSTNVHDLYTGNDLQYTKQYKCTRSLHRQRSTVHKVVQMYTIFTRATIYSTQSSTNVHDLYTGNDLQYTKQYKCTRSLHVQRSTVHKVVQMYTIFTRATIYSTQSSTNVHDLYTGNDLQYTKQYKCTRSLHVQRSTVHKVVQMYTIFTQATIYSTQSSTNVHDLYTGNDLQYTKQYKCTRSLHRQRSTVHKVVQMYTIFTQATIYSTQSSTNVHDLYTGNDLQYTKQYKCTRSLHVQRSTVHKVVQMYTIFTQATIYSTQSSTNVHDLYTCNDLQYTKQYKCTRSLHVQRSTVHKVVQMYTIFTRATIYSTQSSTNVHDLYTCNDLQYTKQYKCTRSLHRQRSTVHKVVQMYTIFTQATIYSTQSSTNVHDLYTGNDLQYTKQYKCTRSLHVQRSTVHKVVQMYTIFTQATIYSTQSSTNVHDLYTCNDLQYTKQYKCTRSLHVQRSTVHKVVQMYTIFTQCNDLQYTKQYKCTRSLHRQRSTVHKVVQMYTIFTRATIYSTQSSTNVHDLYTGNDLQYTKQYTCTRSLHVQRSTVHKVVQMYTIFTQATIYSTQSSTNVHDLYTGNDLQYTKQYKCTRSLHVQRSTVHKVVQMYTIFTQATIYSTQSSTNVHDLYTCNDLQYTKQYKCTRSLHRQRSTVHKVVQMYTIFTRATIYSTQSSTNVHDLYTGNDLQYTKQYKCTRSLHVQRSTVHKVVQMYTIFTRATIYSTQSSTNVHDLYTCNDLQYTKQYKCTRSLHRQRSTVHKVVQMYTIFTRATIYSTQSSTNVHDLYMCNDLQYTTYNVHDLYTCNDLQYTKQYKCTRSLHRQRSTVHKVVQMYTIFTQATIYSTQSSTNVHDLYTCNDLQYTKQYKCTRSLHVQRSTVHKVVQMYTIFTQRATIYSTQKQYKCTRSLHVQRSTVHKVVQMYTIFTRATIYSTQSSTNVHDLYTATIYSTQSSTNVHDLYTCNDLQYTKQYKCTRSLHRQRSTVHKVVQMYTIFTRATIYSTQSSTNVHDLYMCNDLQYTTYNVHDLYTCNDLQYTKQYKCTRSLHRQRSTVHKVVQMYTIFTQATIYSTQSSTNVHDLYMCNDLQYTKQYKCTRSLHVQRSTVHKVVQMYTIFTCATIYSTQRIKCTRSLHVQRSTVHKVVQMYTIFTRATIYSTQSSTNVHDLYTCNDLQYTKQYKCTRSLHRQRSTVHKVVQMYTIFTQATIYSTQSSTNVHDLYTGNDLQYTKQYKCTRSLHRQRSTVHKVVQMYTIFTRATIYSTQSSTNVHDLYTCNDLQYTKQYKCTRSLHVQRSTVHKVVQMYTIFTRATIYSTQSSTNVHDLYTGNDLQYTKQYKCTRSLHVQRSTVHKVVQMYTIFTQATIYSTQSSTNVHDLYTGNDLQYTKQYKCTRSLHVQRSTVHKVVQMYTIFTQATIYSTQSSTNVHDLYTGNDLQYTKQYKCTRSLHRQRSTVHKVVQMYTIFTRATIYSTQSSTNVHDLYTCNDLQYTKQYKCTRSLHRQRSTVHKVVQMYTIFTRATIYSTQSSTNVHDLYTGNDLQYTKQYKCTRSLHVQRSTVHKVVQMYTIFTRATIYSTQSSTNVHDLYTCNDLQYTKQYKCTRSLHRQRSTVHKVVQMYTIFTRATIYSTQSSTNVHDLYTCNDLQYTKQYKCTRSLHVQRSTVHKVVQMYTIFTQATIYSTQSSTNVHDLYTATIYSTQSSTNVHDLYTGNDLQYTKQYKCTRSLHRQRSTVHKVVQMYTIFTQATIYSTQSSTNVHDLYTGNDLQYTKQYKCTRSLHVQRSTVHKVVQMYTIFTQATIYSTQSSTNVHDLYTCNDLQYTKQYKCTRSLHRQRSTVHKVVQMYTIFTQATIYSTQSSTNVHDLYTGNDLQYTKQYKCTRSLHRQRSTVHKVVQMYTIFTQATIYSTQSSTNVHDLYTGNDLQYTKQYKCTRSLHRQRSTVHKVVQMYTIYTGNDLQYTTYNVHDLYTGNDLQYTKQYKCTQSLHVQRSTVHKVVQMYTIFTLKLISSIPKKICILCENVIFHE